MSIEDKIQKNIELISQIEEKNKAQKSRGEKVSDSIASVIGSWPFILTQSSLLLLWIAVNYFNPGIQWDKFPYILLNLMLSIQAAFTGPIVLMAQNRQAKLSEQRKILDAQVNMIAEEEQTLVLTILSRIAEKAGVDISDLSELDSFTCSTPIEKLEEQIKEKDLG